MTSTESVVQPDPRGSHWCWNDPMNLMTYVTFVFQEYFGYDERRRTD